MDDNQQSEVDVFFRNKMLVAAQRRSWPCSARRSTSTRGDASSRQEALDDSDRLAVDLHALLTSILDVAQ